MTEFMASIPTALMGRGFISKTTIMQCNLHRMVLSYLSAGAAFDTPCLTAFPPDISQACIESRRRIISRLTT